jgi:putative acetyltransferase
VLPPRPTHRYRYFSSIDFLFLTRALENSLPVYGRAHHSRQQPDVVAQTKNNAFRVLHRYVDDTINTPTPLLIIPTKERSFNFHRERIMTRTSLVLALIILQFASPALSFIISPSTLSSATLKSSRHISKMTAQDVNTNTKTDIKIVAVKCKDDEPPILKQGVAELFKLYFDELYDLGCDLGFQGFQNEWIDLPGKYDFDKRGGLFVATSSDSSSDEIEVIGCIAIRPLDDKCGEVKRMYIRKSHRRNGVGKLLAETIVDHAWELDYEEIKLDSLERLKGAVALYENLGFSRIEPYCECPEDDHVCMNLFKNKE